MRVLIFEPQYVGHNLAHAAWLARGVAELGCEPILATSTQALASDEYPLHFGNWLRERVTLLPMEGFRSDRHGRKLRTGGLTGAAAVHRALVRAVDEGCPDHVYVPYGNQVSRIAALPLGLRGALRRAGAEAETLLVSGRFLRAEAGFGGRMRRRVMLETIARGPWTSVFHMDDAAHALFQAHGGRMARIGKRAVDCYGERPAADRLTARRALGLPVEGRIVLVAGLIERRKGIVELINAVRSLGDRLLPDDRLCFAGLFHPEVRALLADEHADLAASGRVIALDRRLTNDDLNRALRAADVVATVYPHHPYTSGVLVAAAAAERPLLASAGGWIGRTTRQFGLGHTCDAANPTSVAEQLLSALDASGAYQPTAAGRRFIEYSSRANFVATWTARLRERIGLGPSPDVRAWDWVLAGDNRAAEPAVFHMRAPRRALANDRVGAAGLLAATGKAALDDPKLGDPKLDNPGLGEPDNTAVGPPSRF